MDGAGLVHVPAKPCVTRSTVHQGYEPALLVTQLGLFGETSRDKEKTGAVWHQWSRLEDRVQVESGKDAPPVCYMDKSGWPIESWQAWEDCPHLLNPRTFS